MYILELWGPYGPFVLSPAEGMGAPQAPCQVWVIFFFFFVFFVFFCLLFGLFCLLFVSFLSFLSFCPFCSFLSFLSFCLFVFLTFCLFAFLSFCLFVTHHPMTFSVPNKNTGKCSGMSVHSCLNGIEIEYIAYCKDLSNRPLFQVFIGNIF